MSDEAIEVDKAAVETLPPTPEVYKRAEVRPDVSGWHIGEPAARELGVAALKALGCFPVGSAEDIRAAVATLQARWGHPVSGTLTPAEWAQMLDEADAAAEKASYVESPRRTESGVKPKKDEESKNV